MGLSETKKDRPWLVRTYSGHSSAAASNELYKRNLAQGQTGLSIAFDLPTQTGYDADDPLAAGEVGKVGVPISHLGDMDRLFEGIPLDEMNTSMTINATAAWLMALYIALAERRGIAPAALRGTTQNDIIKEYLSRGTYIFPPGPSLRLIADTVTYAVREMPKWNPTNICSYHLQEAGATPVQEIAYALGTAMTVLDATRDSGKIDAANFPQTVGRLSFFVNSGIRFIEECCKLRAFTALWDEITRIRYNVTDPKFRRFRYGVQVNSLGLTEPQPENNVQRIVLEMLGVVLSKNARARAVQLPAWNEALGLPRPWDQQWALRIQQVVIHETDLLEYGDIFDGSPVIEAKTQEIIAGVRDELAAIEAEGGMIAAVESGFIKRRLVQSHTARMRAIERGALKIVGVNCFTKTAPSPLTAGETAHVLKPDLTAEGEQIARLVAHKKNRDAADVKAALSALKEAAKSNTNIMRASIRCAHAGVTTGEWAGTLRAVFGEYRPVTGVDITHQNAGKTDDIEKTQAAVQSLATRLGRPLKLIVGKPGLDGHSNGAEQIAVKARDVGFEVVYEGIRLTPAQIAASALEEGAHAIGLSILSGSHLPLVKETLAALKAVGCAHVPLVVGGIIPPNDAQTLKDAGVACIFTPKDHDLNAIMRDIVVAIEASNDQSAPDDE